MSGKFGATPAEDGVNARSDTGRGVVGVSDRNDGVWGESKGFDSAGVRGVYHDPNAVRHLGERLEEPLSLLTKPTLPPTALAPVPRPGSAVLGIHYGAERAQGHGVRGESNFGDGVWGSTFAPDKTGVFGWNQSRQSSPPGVAGGNGVFGWSSVPNASGVYGLHDHGGIGVAGFCANGIGVLGAGGNLAGRFEGKVEVNGDLRVSGNAGRFECDVEVTGDVRLINADCAERFDVVAGADISPGTVMVVGEEEILKTSSFAYDKRVIGVVSGAGDYRPAIVLDSKGHEAQRPAIALLGKVYCKVDARRASIGVGDPLTTSETPGHAMKADGDCARGAILGKALGKIADGTGIIPILVTLQ